MLKYKTRKSAFPRKSGMPDDIAFDASSGFTPLDAICVGNGVRNTQISHKRPKLCESTGDIHHKIWQVGSSDWQKYIEREFWKFLTLWPVALRKVQAEKFERFRHYLPKIKTFKDAAWRFCRTIGWIHLPWQTTRYSHILISLCYMWVF